MARRTHSREFKLEAVRLVREQGVSVTQASRDLGIHLNTLRGWLQRIDADPEHAFPGQGKPSDSELAKLKRELKRVTMERDILKKAIAYFAKEPT
jgi:transposase